MYLNYSRQTLRIVMHHPHPHIYVNIDITNSSLFISSSRIRKPLLLHDSKANSYEGERLEQKKWENRDPTATHLSSTNLSHSQTKYCEHVSWLLVYSCQWYAPIFMTDASVVHTTIIFYYAKILYEFEIVLVFWFIYHKLPTGIPTKTMVLFGWKYSQPN